jgi:hypothetical protein
MEKRRALHPAFTMSRMMFHSGRLACQLVLACSTIHGSVMHTSHSTLMSEDLPYVWPSHRAT